MKLIVCVDKTNGLSFNHRRQSRDRAVTADLLALCGTAALWVQPQSAALFAAAPQLRVAEDCLLCAGEGEFCFWEDVLPPEAAPRVRGLVRYRWSRRYPADTVFRFDPEAAGLRLKSRLELAGYSHQTILREVYGYG